MTTKRPAFEGFFFDAAHQNIGSIAQDARTEGPGNVFFGDLPFLANHWVSGAQADQLAFVQPQAAEFSGIWTI